MRQKLLILLLLLLLTASSVQALTISPSSTNIDIFTLASQEMYVNVTNELNTSIYYVTLKTSNTDITFVNNLFNLTAGETKQIKINIDTSDSYSKTETVKVYYFEKQQVQLIPTEEIVKITNTQYNPRSITIIQGSTIRFTNNDTIKHSVTSTLFDQDLNPAQEYGYVFSNSGIFQYHDKYTNYEGEVIVKETLSNEFVHDPTKDTAFSIKIRSTLVETDIELIFTEGTNFTVNASDEKESVFIIKNIGNISVALANFNARPQWITFSRENLIIKPLEQSYVPFKIFPLVTYSNETGKVYLIEIRVRADNILDKYYNISVFVPFKEKVDTTNILKRLNQTITEEFAVTLHNTICKANPEYSICQPQVIEKIIYKTPVLEFNMTVEEFVELRRKILENAADQKLGYANIQEQVLSIKGNAEETNSKSAETLALARELITNSQSTQQDLKNLFVFFLVITIIATLAILLSGIFLLIKKFAFANREFKT